MLPQLERQFLQADLAQVRSLLLQSPIDEDPIEHLQFSSRVREIEAQLARISETITTAPAGAALFFGGNPVVGSHGIKASFGSKAVGHFQKLVSLRFAADEQGPVASRGRVPLTDATQLLVTDVVRGSFGFVLEAASTESSGETSLKTAVDEVADTLSKMAAPDEALFDQASAGLDDRQLGTLKEFFKLLDDEGASLRLVEGERDFELDRSAVMRARGRVEGLRISDRVEERVGKIVGWTQYSHRFELRLDDDGPVLQGQVSREAMEAVVTGGLNPLNRRFRVMLKVREFHARSRAARLAFTLQSMDAVSS